MKLSELPVRVFRIVRFGARETLAWRALSQSLGIRRALFQRLRSHLELSGLEQRVSDLETQQTRLQSALAAESGRVGTLEEQLRQARQQAAQLERRERLAGERLRSLEQRLAYSAWAERAAPALPELVSVILATRNRSALLPRAVDSVLTQAGANLEVIIVDDGSTDDTPLITANLADPRVRVVRTEARGVSAARNRGLAEAKGSLITYVDDDNLMWPGWLKAVAWAFHEHPSVDVLYGARLVERQEGQSAAPFVSFEPFDRQALEQNNFIDQGVIAHRAGLPGARYDEALSACVDWDLILRLTKEKPPLALPVVASAYFLTAPNRISARAQPEVESSVVRRRHARRLKVLAYNSMAPLISESYISDELAALVRHGAALAYCREHVPAAPASVPERVYSHLETAIAEYRPDVLFIHWASHAQAQLPRLERLGVPFALRTHSFDFDPAAVAQLASHPLCIGVWCYPHHAALVPGAHDLVPLFTSLERMPPPHPTRDLVLSASAGLPKKNWDVLLEAMSALPEVERRVVVGITNQHESIPTLLAQKLSGVRHPPLLQFNLERDDVFRLLSRTAVVVYTLAPDVPQFGMPMSIIEGLCAGACVVAPDRPEARALCGPGFRGYRTSADIVAHIEEVLAGGPAIDAERALNLRVARERFGSVRAQQQLMDELTSALERLKIPASHSHSGV